MTPEAANQKRKRGRTSNASREDRTASQTQLTITKSGLIAKPQQHGVEVDAEEESRPRKRGRQAKANSQAQEEPRKKRGRPAASQEPAEPEGEGAASEMPKGKQKGRPPASKQAEREDTTNETAPEADKSKKGRPPKASRVAKENEAVREEADDENEEYSSLIRRSGRERRSVGDWYKVSPQNTTKHSEPEQEAEDEPPDGENEGESSIVRRSGRDRLSVGAWFTGAREDSDPGEQVVEPKRLKKGKKGARVSPDKAHPSESTGASASQARAKKRGVPPPNQERVEETSATSQSKSKKRGRPSLPGAEVDNSVQQKPRIRKRRDDQPEKPEKHFQQNPREGRTREVQQESMAENSSQQRPRKRRNKEAPNEEPEAEESLQQTSRKRKNKGPTVEEEPVAEEDPQRRGRKRLSDAATSASDNCRRATNYAEEEARSPSPESDVAPYRHLKEEVRRVTRQTIDDKWNPLEPASISSITALLHSASRPVLLRLNNLQKHGQATAALSAVNNSLRRKLVRGMPFPPATTTNKREEELEFERITAGIRALEARLDPLLHSVDLLRKEKERMEKELEHDYRVLNTLGANSRVAGKERRIQLRKLHPLVPDPQADEVWNRQDCLGELVPVDKNAGKTFTLEDDEPQGLSGQIASHMESMRGNLQHIDGISPAIRESSAALRMALLPHLDGERFDQVLLG